MPTNLSKRNKSNCNDLRPYKGLQSNRNDCKIKTAMDNLMKRYRPTFQGSGKV